RPPESSLAPSPFSALPLPCPASPPQLSTVNLQLSTFNHQPAGHSLSLPIPKGLPPSAQGCDAPPFCVATLGNESLNSANPESGCIIRSFLLPRFPAQQPSTLNHHLSDHPPPSKPIQISSSSLTQ